MPSPDEIRQAPAPSPNSTEVAGFIGAFSATVDIFSDATTSTLPCADASRAPNAIPNSDPALAIGRSIAGTLSSPSRFATLAAGPGNRRGDDPLATISSPRFGGSSPV